MVAAPLCFLSSPNRYVGKTDDCAHLPLHVVRILIVSRDFLSGTVIEFFISIFSRIEYNFRDDGDRRKAVSRASEIIYEARVMELIQGGLPKLVLYLN